MRFAVLLWGCFLSQLNSLGSASSKIPSVRKEILTARNFRLSTCKRAASRRKSQQFKKESSLHLLQSTTPRTLSTSIHTDRAMLCSPTARQIRALPATTTTRRPESWRGRTEKKWSWTSITSIPTNLWIFTPLCQRVSKRRDSLLESLHLTSSEIFQLVQSSLILAISSFDLCKRRPFISATSTPSPFPSALRPSTRVSLRPQTKGRSCLLNLMEASTSCSKLWLKGHSSTLCSTSSMAITSSSWWSLVPAFCQH